MRVFAVITALELLQLACANNIDKILLTEEEEKLSILPEKMKCDGCRAVTFTL